MDAMQQHIDEYKRLIDLKAEKAAEVKVINGDIADAKDELLAKMKESGIHEVQLNAKKTLYIEEKLTERKA